MEVLRKWIYRNQISFEEKWKLNPTEKERLHQTSQDDWSPKGFVYCSKKDHKSSDCKTITEVEDRKKILSEISLHFDCTKVKHRATECRNKRIYQTCKDKHYSPFCKRSSTMMVTTVGSVIHHVMIVNPFVLNALFL